MYGEELIASNAISPVAIGGTGSIHSGIGAIDKDILNGEDNGIGVTCHKGFDYHNAAVIPIIAFAVAVFEHTGASFGI